MTIIIDNGSGNIKIALSNINFDNANKPLQIPNIIGRPIHWNNKALEDFELRPIMRGDEVNPVRSLLQLSYPTIQGDIVNFEDMSILWDYCIKNKLGIYDVRDRKILLTEPPLNSNDNRKKMFEIIFEKLGFGYCNFESQAKLCLFAHGNETGMVLDSGEDSTYSIPVQGGVILRKQIKRLDVAGRHINYYLIKLLQSKGYSFIPDAHLELVREIKEKYCFVSCYIDSDRKLEEETTYYNSFVNLPDRTKIRISSEKFEAPEILFRTWLIKNEKPGIHEMICNSINVR